MLRRYHRRQKNKQKWQEEFETTGTRHDMDRFEGPDTYGTTANVGILTDDDRLIVANVGDSRSIISRRGVAHALSQDQNGLRKGRTYPFI